ncbi:transketolase [Desulfonatronum thiosulfatophilum]|uniref:Transketolase n=1 Tax=Desulfonatronum thiosulfatophilum TaxID=617002 RepID=A0A1G6E3V4_9BACT|nr:transketolase [Desulfonatronum thiosulfatophilum]SDB52061.1 transketolase [Desulfonatronum thiosulfatophilum]
MDKVDARLTEIAHYLRVLILQSTTEAGSGHPTSSLSAVELMAGLMFGESAEGKPFFRFDPNDPKHPNNDRLIFSKGHASPLFYSLWAAAGQLSLNDMLTYRKLDSPLEGHPTPRFAFTEAATGSLGQGLGVGVGMALNAKYLDKLPYRTFVLLGDSEMTEGSQWEAVQIAAHYKLNNLVGILDVNRLGQRGETMYGHDIESYARRVEAFGWETILVQDGHDFQQVIPALTDALNAQKPLMIIARTFKGKGVPLMENLDDWHGKPLNAEQGKQALRELGHATADAPARLAEPERLQPAKSDPQKLEDPAYEAGGQEATRVAYGRALARLGAAHPELVVLDAEVSNSTMADIFRKKFPDRFFEMYVAEQNMVSTGLGLAVRGKLVFVSTFAAFLVRAYDQVRMARYSDANLKFCGSHAGVSIGEDGPSQMGLEDIAFFRTILDSVVLYPSDAMSTERLVEEAARHHGMVYLRTTRAKTPLLYDARETFPIGGCKVLRESSADRATLVAAGITLHEALKAADTLQKQGISVRVIDLYSVKPLDEETLRRAAKETGVIITVEDHAAQGGIGEAVLSAVAATPCLVHKLAVTRLPRSGTPRELLELENIDEKAVVRAVQGLVAS